jgi:glycosyltransferase involved in cell wall biosynthesis
MIPHIAVFHPGMQHSYQTALAFQRAGRLAWYATGIFYTPNRWPYTVLPFVPSYLRQRLERELRRRYHPELDPGLLRTFGYWEWIERIGMRLGQRRLEHHANELGNASFAKRVARWALRDAVDCVWGFDTASLRTFTEVKGRGIRCVLEQTIGHPRIWNRILTEERERLGYEFDPYPRPYPERDLAKVDAEIESADGIVCGSEFVKKTLVEEGVYAGKLHVIPYGADPNAFVPAPSPGVADQLRLLFVGHFGIRKGAWYLTEALNRLRRLHGLSLTVVGTQTVPTKALAPIADKVRVVPRVPGEEMARIYQGADVLVLPSLFEGSSIAIYEALASGLPVVTTPNAGSIVRDGIEGCIVPVRDVDSLVSSIEFLYRERDARLAMGRRARQRALEFPWRRYADGVVQLSEQLIGERVA